MNKIDLIVFDWDDVFTLGSREGYFKCYHETLLELGIVLDSDVEKERILSKWGQPHREELRALLKEHPQMLDEACTIYENKLFGDTFVDSLSLIDGAIDLLQMLSSKYTLAVATGQHPTIFHERIVPTFGIPDVFSQVVTAYDLDDPSKAKPSPHMLKLILTTQAVPADRAIMVGDAITDMEMAIAADVTPVAVLTGHMDRQQAEVAGAEHILNSVIDLGTVL